MRRLIVLIFSLGLIVAIGRFCHRQTDGLATHKMRKAFEKNTFHPIPSAHHSKDTELVHTILQQPLTYIGRGGQCFAFSTPDNNYVVKILKYNNNYPQIWFQLFPFPFSLENYRQSVLSKKKKKLEGEYNSYQIAFQELAEETGLIYSHFDSGSLTETTKIHIIDKLNIHHKLPADALQFFIQKKGTPLYPEFLRLLNEGKIEEAQKALDEISSYLVKRCQKKITDNDDGIWRNFAFSQGIPFQIDIGQFRYNPNLISEESFKKDILYFTKDFRNWLEKISPALAEHFTHSIETNCLNSFHSSENDFALQIIQN